MCQTTCFRYSNACKVATRYRPKSAFNLTTAFKQALLEGCKLYLKFNFLGPYIYLSPVLKKGAGQYYEIKKLPE